MCGLRCQEKCYNGRGRRYKRNFRTTSDKGARKLVRKVLHRRFARLRKLQRDLENVCFLKKQAARHNDECNLANSLDSRFSTVNIPLHYRFCVTKTILHAVFGR